MELSVDGHRAFAAGGGRPFDPRQRAVVMVHGAALDHTYWHLHSRWFAWHGWSVLAVDLPGHGRSDGEPSASIGEMAAWLGRAMDAAGLDEAAIVGHSMGAAVSLEAAAAMPERVTRLVLLGVADAIPVHPDLLAAAAAGDPLAYDLMTAWGHGHAARLGGHPSPGLWMLGGARALFARSRPGVLFRDLTACNDWSHGLAAARRVPCPTLVAIGPDDVMTPPARGRAVAEALPAGREVVIPGSGHMMLIENPDATLDALVDGLGG